MQMVKFPQVLTKELFPKGGLSHFRRALGSFPEGALVLGVQGGGSGKERALLGHERASARRCSGQEPVAILGPSWALAPMSGCHHRMGPPAAPPPRQRRWPGSVPPAWTAADGEVSSDYTQTPRSLFLAQQLTLPTENTDQHP